MNQLVKRIMSIEEQNSKSQESSISSDIQPNDPNLNVNRQEEYSIFEDIDGMEVDNHDEIGNHFNVTNMVNIERTSEGNFIISEGAGVGYISFNFGNEFFKNLL